MHTLTRIRRSRAGLLCIFIAILLFWGTAAGEVYADSGQKGEKSQKTLQPSAQLGLLITGPEVKGDQGFLKDIRCLTVEEMKRIQTEKNPEAFGLGNSWAEKGRFSSYDNHGSGNYHYSLASGLDVMKVLEHVTKEGGKRSRYWIWSSDSYSNKCLIAHNENLKYFAPGDKKGVLSAGPMIALYKSTTVSGDASQGKEPGGEPQLLKQEDWVYMYGQHSPEEDNNCHYIKGANAIYVGDPVTLLETKNDKFAKLRLKDLMQTGIYRTDYEAAVKGRAYVYPLEGVPLEKVASGLKLMPYLADYSKNMLELEAEDGTKVELSYADMKDSFLAWGFTQENLSLDGQTGQLAVFFPGPDKNGRIFQNLKSISVVDAKGNYVTVPPQKPAPEKPAPAKPILGRTTVTGISKNKGNAVTLTWKKVKGAKGYEIYRAVKRSGQYKKIKTVKRNTNLSFKNRNLKKGKTYYYKVRAYRIAGGKKQYGTFSAAKRIKR